MAQGEWPTLTDYGDALQHPGRSLYNFEDLREAEVERNSLRRPKGRAGNFAIVYKITGAKGPRAAKFFKNRDNDRERRYKAVSDYLNRNRTGYTVGFDYYEQGVYVNSDYFPVLLMEWVEGLPLGNWFHDKAKAKDAKALLAMADEWVKLVTALQQAKIAHGDLQHGNVLVVNGKPKLVDYDGMCVPDLLNAEQLERGVNAYQHPERAEQHLGPNLDQFSAWIILISLRAVAADPAMYARYKIRPGDTEPHENLLFVKEDVHGPGDRARAKNADIWRDLQKSPDPQVREWAATLCQSIELPFDRIPKLSVAQPVVDPLPPIRAAVASGDWPLVLRLAKGVKLPNDLKEKADLAQRRVDCRDALKRAIDANDRKAVRDAYAPALLDDWPACKPLVQQAKVVLQQQGLLQKIQEAAKNIGDGRAFVKEWDACAGILAGTPEGKRCEEVAEHWRSRIAAADVFLAKLKQGADERSLAAAWRQVEKRPPLHPDITAAHQARGRQAFARMTLLDSLDAVPNESTEDNDRRLVEGWDEKLLGGCRDAAALKRRVESARERLAAVAELRKCISAADKGGDEQAVVAAGKKLPYGDLGLRKRIALANDRLLLEVELRNALKSDSDRAIKQAWAKAQKKLAGRRRPDRFKLAVKRCELLDRLEAIDSEAPLDEQDRAWEDLWEEDLLRDCIDAESLRSRFELAKRRLTAWRELESALAAGAPIEVRTKAAAKILAGYPPLKKNDALIQELIRKADGVDRILNKLKQAGNGSALGENDLQVLRTTPELFNAEARRQIEAHFRQRLGSTLRLAAIDDGFESGGGGSYVTLRWTWPDSTLISCCYVALDDDEPPQAPGPRPLTCTAEVHRRAGGGMRCLAGSGLYATIWPVVKLGWTDLLGQPLSIGPIVVSESNGAVSGKR